MEGPTFRVKPGSASQSSWHSHWGQGPGPRAELKGRRGLLPSRPGLLPPSDAEGPEPVGRLGVQAGPTAKAREGRSPLHLTRSADGK